MTSDAVEFDTVCPFCDYHHDRVSGVTGAEYPEDGDATLCFRCGLFCIFDHDASGGLRKPTEKEQRLIDRDDRMNEIVRAWKITRRG
jgi:hypothetical protein